jgi:homoserine O-succinyltransferase/O-acetyltransferase
MPILLPEGLPAARALRAEGIGVADARDGRAAAGGPALRIALLNLMPDKPTAETQFARLLGAGPRRVELTLLAPETHAPGATTPAAHLRAFYRPWPEAGGGRFDGLVVTGAPVETLDFAAVTYWPELRRILDRAQAQGTAILAICWGAMAALRHFHSVPKHILPQKRSGVFRQRVLVPDAPLLRGFGAAFAAPVSRRAEVRAADLPACARVLAASAESGPCLVEDRALGLTAVLDHLEYDAGTLRAEFRRDRAAGAPAAPPRDYFPGDDPDRAPANTWRPHGLGLFGNWLAEVERRTCRGRPRDRLVA